MFHLKHPEQLQNVRDMLQEIDSYWQGYERLETVGSKLSLQLPFEPVKGKSKISMGNLLSGELETLNRQLQEEAQEAVTRLEGDEGMPQHEEAAVNESSVNPAKDSVPNLAERQNQRRLQRNLGTLERILKNPEVQYDLHGRLVRLLLLSQGIPEEMSEHLLKLCFSRQDFELVPDDFNLPTNWFEMNRRAKKMMMLVFSCPWLEHLVTCEMAEALAHLALEDNSDVTLVHAILLPKFPLFNLVRPNHRFRHSTRDQQQQYSNMIIMLRTVGYGHSPHQVISFPPEPYSKALSIPTGEREDHEKRVTRNLLRALNRSKLLPLTYSALALLKKHEEGREGQEGEEDRVNCPTQ